MSQLRWRLIFGEKDVHLQDFGGREIRTFQKSDFLTKAGWYKVTESLLGDFSDGLLIEINVPIEVSTTFKAQINANVSGAIANANEDGAIANANNGGSTANANADGAIAIVRVYRAIANANANGAILKSYGI